MISPSAARYGEGRQTKFSFYDQDMDFLESEPKSYEKKVRFIPIIDSLFQESVASAESCSFASSLTTTSSQPKDVLSSTKADGRLSQSERKKILADCRTYRLQITTFEDLFLKEHGHMPTGSKEKAQLATVYAQYREGKRAIRADAACRIQALCCGFLVRLNQKKKKAATVAGALDNEGKEIPPMSIKEMAEKCIRELGIMRTGLMTKGTVYTTEQVDNELVTNENSIPPEVEKAIKAMLSSSDPIASTSASKNASKEVEKAIEAMLSSSDPITIISTSQNASITEEHLSQEMISKYLKPDEKRKIATKALSSKLIEKEYKLPKDISAPEAICSVCEMPKLASKNGTIVETCVVCDELHKKVIKRKKKQEKKSGSEMRQKALEQKKINHEKDVLQKTKSQMEERTGAESLKLKPDAQRYEMVRQKNKEWFHKAFNGELSEQYREKDWSVSVPSTLHVPVAVKANHNAAGHNKQRRKTHRGLDESIDTPASTSSEEEEWENDGYGEVNGGSRILHNLHNEVKRADNSDNSSDTFTTAVEKQDKKKEKKEVKDEFDSLLDDASIEQLQRKIRGCPSPHPSEKATAPEDYRAKNRRSEKKHAAESEKKSKMEHHAGNDNPSEPEANHNDTSYAGFASRSDYDNFQQMYGEFEKDHADVVDYVRERVDRSGRTKKEYSHDVRSSSMPSLSSLGSREFDDKHYYSRREEGYRHHRHRHRSPMAHRAKQSSGRRDGRYREHRRHSQDYDSSDSMSELSLPHFEDECGYRHHHYSHSRDRHASRGRKHRSRPREEYHHRSQARSRSYGRRRRDDHHHYSNNYISEHSPRPIDQRKKDPISFNDIINNGKMRGSGELFFDFGYEG